MKDIRTEVIFGGEPKANHVKMLKGLTPPHIIVGTPGRILDLIRDKTLSMDNLQIFVLDECDKLLDQVSKYRQNKLNLCRHEKRHPENLQRDPP